jgi:hypothetical protein
MNPLELHANRCTFLGRECIIFIRFSKNPQFPKSSELLHSVVPPQILVPSVAVLICINLFLYHLGTYKDSNFFSFSNLCLFWGAVLVLDLRASPFAQQGLLQALYHLSHASSPDHYSFYAAVTDVWAPCPALLVEMGERECFLKTFFFALAGLKHDLQISPS